ncbi:MAG: hypothetical protein V3W19_04805 [Desulfatiglandales bacterium]
MSWATDASPQYGVYDMKRALVNTRDRGMRDPDFQKDIKKKLGGYPQYVGEEARRAFNRALDVRPESMNWLKNWLKKRFNVQF